MKVIWDEEKAGKLKNDRNISLDEIADLLMNQQFIEILEHPQRSGQMIFIVPYHNYIHAVPFIIDGNGAIVLKTAYPSRKYHKRFGGTSRESKA